MVNLLLAGAAGALEGLADLASDSNAAEAETAKFQRDLSLLDRKVEKDLESKKALKKFESELKQDNFTEYLSVIENPELSEADKRIMGEKLGVPVSVTTAAIKANKRGLGRDVIADLEKNMRADAGESLSESSIRFKTPKSVDEQLDAAVTAHRRALNTGDKTAIERTKFDVDLLRDKQKVLREEGAVPDGVQTDLVRGAIAAEEAVADVLRFKKVLSDQTVGIMGGLRGTWQNIMQQSSAMKNWSNDIERRVGEDELLTPEAKGRLHEALSDPNLDARKALTIRLSYTLARANNVGRLTNQMLTEAREQIGADGWMVGAESINNRLDTLLDDMTGTILRNRKRLPKKIKLTPQVKRVILSRKGLNKNSKKYKQLIEKGFTDEQIIDKIMSRL